MKPLSYKNYNEFQHEFNGIDETKVQVQEIDPTTFDHRRIIHCCKNKKKSFIISVPQ